MRYIVVAMAQTIPGVYAPIAKRKPSNKFGILLVGYLVVCWVGPCGLESVERNRHGLAYTV